MDQFAPTYQAEPNFDWSAELNQVQSMIEGLVTTLKSVAVKQQQLMLAFEAGPPRSRADSRLGRPPKRKGAERSGLKWTRQEDEDIIRQFEAGASVREIALAQRRSWVAIVCRLEAVGYIPLDLRLSDFEHPRAAQEKLPF
jgi:hypothetical protein